MIFHLISDCLPQFVDNQYPLESPSWGAPSKAPMDLFIVTKSMIGSSRPANPTLNDLINELLE